jgi:general secretion pathway protein D
MTPLRSPSGIRKIVAYLALLFCLGLGSVGRTAEPPQTKPPAEGAGATMPSAEPLMVRGSGVVIAPPKNTPALKGAGSAFRFEDAPIADVIRVVLSDIMKVDYVLHPPIAGTVTMATRAEVPPDQAVMLLEGALQANGLLMAMDTRGVYHVGRPDALRGIVAAPRQAVGAPLPPGYGTVVVPLQYIGAGEMATILRPLMPAEALVRVDPLRNLLILVGTRSQAEGWLAMVATFDVDILKGMSVAMIPLKHTSVREVEAALRLLSPSAATPAGAGPATASASGTTAPPAASGAATFIGAVRILPIERINSLLVVTPNLKYLDDARSWIERLDQPGSSGEAQLFVYPVQNGSAKHLAMVLNGLFGAAGGSVAPTPTTPATTGVAPGLTVGTGLTMGSSGGGFGSSLGGSALTQAGSRPATAQPGVTAVNLGQGVRVIADEINNAILIYGDRRDYAKIEAALRRLDLAPTQVLIEASIIEVTLRDDLQYGLQWAFSDSKRGGSSGLSGNGVLSAAAGGVLGGALAGFSYTLSNSMGNIRAVLNALADKSLVKVISSPSLMVLDNHTAAISVGNQQPIQSGTTITSGAVISNSIQYKDTGVNLSVTPSVNAGNIVTMLINQAVTDVGAIDLATGQRAFLQRQISSKVAVRSGESLVLGGLIRDNTTSGKSGLPVLQDIPIFGSLFGTNSRNTDRTELLVVITPRVVRSDQDAREVGSELRERMKSFAPLSSVAPGL